MNNLAVHVCLYGWGDKIMRTVLFHDVMQSRSTAFLHDRRLLCTSNVSWRVFSTKRLQTINYRSLHTTEDEVSRVAEC